MYNKEYDYDDEEDIIQEALDGLIEKGMVETFTGENGEKMYRLTELGKAVVPEIDTNLN